MGSLRQCEEDRRLGAVAGVEAIHRGAAGVVRGDGAGETTMKNTHLPLWRLRLQDANGYFITVFSRARTESEARHLLRIKFNRVAGMRLKRLPRGTAVENIGGVMEADHA